MVEKADPSKLRDPRDERIAQLTAENENLRGQLAEATARTPAAPVARFVLSEGQRQELAASGVTTGPGGRQLTVEDARRLVGADQERVPVEGPPADTELTLPDRGPAVYGVDYVYPSVKPGVLAPEAAGQPGISGPPAGQV